MKGPTSTCTYCTPQLSSIHSLLLQFTGNTSLCPLCPDIGIWREPPPHRPAQMQSYTSFHSCKPRQGKRELCKAIPWEGVLRAGWHSSYPKEPSPGTQAALQAVWHVPTDRKHRMQLSGDGTAVPDGPTLEQHGGAQLGCNFLLRSSSDCSTGKAQCHLSAQHHLIPFTPALQHNLLQFSHGNSQ